MGARQAVRQVAKQASSMTADLAAVEQRPPDTRVQRSEPPCSAHRPKQPAAKLLADLAAPPMWRPSIIAQTS
jgi:hypothetical protein